MRKLCNIKISITANKPQRGRNPIYKPLWASLKKNDILIIIITNKNGTKTLPKFLLLRP